MHQASLLASRRNRGVFGQMLGGPRVGGGRTEKRGEMKISFCLFACLLFLVRESGFFCSCVGQKKKTLNEESLQGKKHRRDIREVRQWGSSVCLCEEKKGGAGLLR